MGELALLFIFIVVIALIGISLLFGIRSDKAFRIIVVLLFAFSTLLLIMHVTALPENYTARIFIAYMIGALALGSLFFIDKKPIITKVILTFAVIAHIVGIFLI